MKVCASNNKGPRERRGVERGHGLQSAVHTGEESYGPGPLTGLLAAGSPGNPYVVYQMFPPLLCQSFIQCKAACICGLCYSTKGRAIGGDSLVISGLLFLWIIRRAHAKIKNPRNVRKIYFKPKKLQTMKHVRSSIETAAYPNYYYLVEIVPSPARLNPIFVHFGQQSFRLENSKECFCSFILLCLVGWSKIAVGQRT